MMVSIYVYRTARQGNRMVSVYVYRTTGQGNMMVSTIKMIFGKPCCLKQ